MPTDNTPCGFPHVDSIHLVRPHSWVDVESLGSQITCVFASASSGRFQGESGLALRFTFHHVDAHVVILPAFPVPQVVRKILRACTHGCDRQLHPPDDARVRHEGSSKASAVVPLGRLLLRGNNITDAGALALVPLLEESPHVTELDLRDNAIGKNGKMALKKVRQNFDSYVACLGEWTALRMHASGNR